MAHFINSLLPIPRKDPSEWAAMYKDFNISNCFQMSLFLSNTSELIESLKTESKKKHAMDILKGFSKYPILALFYFLVGIPYADIDAIFG